MQNIHEACWETAAEFGTKGNSVAGADIAGFVKVAKAMVAHGLISRSGLVPPSGQVPPPAGL